MWRAVQDRLAANRQGKWIRSGARDERNLLIGLLFDAKGNRFTPSHSVKNGRRYRYYVEHSLITGEKAAKSQLRRIPANEIETAVRDGLIQFLAFPPRLLEALGSVLDASAVNQAIGASERLSHRLRQIAPTVWMAQVRPLLHRVTIGDGTLEIRVNVEALRLALSPGRQTPPSQSKRQRSAGEYAITVRVRMGMRGSQMKLIVGAESRANGNTDPALIKALAQAHDWLERILDGRARSINKIAASERKASSYVGRVLRLAFIAPDIQEAIVEGRQAPEVMAKRLILHEVLPREWDRQRCQFR